MQAIRVSLPGEQLACSRKPRALAEAALSAAMAAAVATTAGVHVGCASAFRACAAAASASLLAMLHAASIACKATLPINSDRMQHHTLSRRVER